MTRTHVSKITGKALDWAVFYALYKPLTAIIKRYEPKHWNSPFGGKGIDFPGGTALVYYGAYDTEISWHPSGNWDQCGPLIDRYKIDLYHHDEYEIDGVVAPMVEASLSDECLVAADAYDPVGETALIAACRAVVSAELGEYMDVPEELL